MVVLELTPIVAEPPDLQHVQAAARTLALPRSAVISTTDGGKALIDTILSRPMFNPDRRPIVTAAASAPGGMARLTGIIVTDAAKFAIFAASASGKPVVVREGGRLGVYDVREIGSEGVTVIGPDGPVVVKPAFDPTPPAARTAVKPLLPAPPPRR